MERLSEAVCGRIAGFAGPHAAYSAACVSKAWFQAFTSIAALTSIIRLHFPWQPLPPPSSLRLLLRTLCAIDGSYVSEEPDAEKRFHSLILTDGHFLWLSRSAPATDPRAQVVSAQEGSYAVMLSDDRVRVELTGAGASETQIVGVEELAPDGHSTLMIGSAVLREDDRIARRAYYTTHEEDLNAPPSERARHRRRRSYWLKHAAQSSDKFSPLASHAPTRPLLTSDKRTLYALIIAQLQSEGLTAVARSLQDATGVSTATLAVSQPLSQLVQIALTRSSAPASSFSSSVSSSRPSATLRTTERSHGLDLDSAPSSSSRSSPSYTTRFVTTHKSGVRCARFSPDGRLVATGSADTSVKLLDAARMATFAGEGRGGASGGGGAKEGGDDSGAGSRPVLRTFYDHSQAVNDLAFHPFVPLLASASKDASIKFFEFTQPAKRASRFIQDTHSVRSIAFHPCGDFLLAGTEHYMIRLYDIATFQAYICSQPEEHHLSAITQVRYAPDGRTFASASKDGSVSIWDATSIRRVKHLPAPHSALPVSSVQITRNGKYLLTGGLDSVCRLWELSTGRQVQAYLGAIQTKNRVQTTFTVDEEFVVSADETSNSALMWDARTAELVQRLPGHTGLVRAIAASDTEAALITCSDDHRARFWTSEALHHSLLSS